MGGSAPAGIAPTAAPTDNLSALPLAAQPLEMQHAGGDRAPAQREWVGLGACSWKSSACTACRSTVGCCTCVLQPAWTLAWVSVTC